MKSAPKFVEIKMDAEISSYQEDFDPTRDPAFARERAQNGERATSELARRAEASHD